MTTSLEGLLVSLFVFKPWRNGKFACAKLLAVMSGITGRMQANVVECGPLHVRDPWVSEEAWKRHRLLDLQTRFRQSECGGGAS